MMEEDSYESIRQPPLHIQAPSSNFSQQGSEEDGSRPGNIPSPVFPHRDTPLTSPVRNGTVQADVVLHVPASGEETPRPKPEQGPMASSGSAGVGRTWSLGGSHRQSGAAIHPFAPFISCLCFCLLFG